MGLLGRIYFKGLQCDKDLVWPSRPEIDTVESFMDSAGQVLIGQCLLNWGEDL